MNDERKKHRRWRLFVDTRLQGEFLLRIAVYWCILLIAVSGTIAAFSFISGGDIHPQRLLVPIVVVSGIILPFIMVDAIAFSNRFAGPVYRLTKHLREMADGTPNGELVFRPKDFYPELRRAVNDIRICEQLGVESEEINQFAEHSDSDDVAPSREFAGAHNE